MTVFVVKVTMPNGHQGNHSAWRNEADARRQASIRNSYHKAEGFSYRVVPHYDVSVVSYRGLGQPMPVAILSEKCKMEVL